MLLTKATGIRTEYGGRSRTYAFSYPVRSIWQLSHSAPLMQAVELLHWNSAPWASPKYLSCSTRRQLVSSALKSVTLRTGSAMRKTTCGADLGRFRKTISKRSFRADILEFFVLGTTGGGVCSVSGGGGGLGNAKGTLCFWRDTALYLRRDSG